MTLRRRGHIDYQEVYPLADKLGRGLTLGYHGLRKGNEHLDAVDVGHDAAAVLRTDDARKDRLVLKSFGRARPVAGRVDALARKVDFAVEIADLGDKGLDLVAHLEHVRRLYGGIVAELCQRDKAGLLGAEIYLHISIGDAGDRTLYLLPSM